MSDDRILTSGEVARLLGVTVGRLWRMVAAGSFPPPCLRYSSRLVRWKEAVVAGWLRARGA